MADWVTDLEEQLKGVYGSKKDPALEVVSAVPAPVLPKPVANKDNSNYMFVFIMIMFVGIFMAWKAKADKQTIGWNNPVQQTPTIPAVTLEQKFELFKKQYANLDEAVNKIWERTKWNSDHITLVGIINNHNNVVIQQNLPKSELILLNRDWSINRLPDRVELTPKDKEFLNKFLHK